MIIPQNKGQALVETAIIAPLAIFMLIGVFEVGWALRSYLVLTNADREVARFAVRPGYVDYDAEQPDFSPIVAHTFQALSRQLEFTPAGVIIVSRIRIDTGYVCDPAIVWDADNPKYLKCDCPGALTNPYTPTIAISPMEVPTYTFTWPETATEVTRLDYAEIVSETVRTNRQHNCDLMNRSPGERPQIDDQITVELIWPHYQLFGFPGWNNPYLDPITMTTHTTMRRLQGR